MASFIIILIVTTLGMMYINRLIKYKFSHEKRPFWKIMHIVAFIIGFLPFLAFGCVVLIDANSKEIGIIILAIFLCLSYKSYRKYKVYFDNK